MIMMNFNGKAGNLNFLSFCHDCSMIVHKPGSQVLTYLSDILLGLLGLIFSVMRVMHGNQ